MYVFLFLNNSKTCKYVYCMYMNEMINEKDGWKHLAFIFMN